jgi:uncharacterized protein YycO
MNKISAKLDDLMNLAKPGDVILMTSNKKISEIIREVTNSDYSHTAMYIGNGEIVESTSGGVRIVDLKIYDDNAHPDFILLAAKGRIHTEDRKQLVKSVLKYVGYRYSYLQIIWGLILRLIGKSENTRWQKDLTKRAMHCSEAVATAYKEIGIYIKPDMIPAGVEPVDFLESKVFNPVYKIDT